MTALPPHTPILLLVIHEKIDGVLLRILPPVVVAHDGLRVFVLRHHPRLPVGQAGVERPRDGRPAQVVRRQVSEALVVSPPFDDLPRHPRREWFVEVECTVVRVRLDRTLRRVFYPEVCFSVCCLAD